MSERKNQSITFRIKANQERFDDICKEQNISKSKIIRGLIDRFIAAYDDSRE